MSNALEPQPNGAPPRRLPIRLVFGLGVAILLDTVLQVVWKQAAVDLPDNGLDNIGGLLITIASQPICWVIGALLVAQMYNWLEVLRDADVSYALPITSLSYVSVAIVSALWLNEAITPARVAGVGLILAGVILISRTDHNTLIPRGPL